MSSTSRAASRAPTTASGGGRRYTVYSYAPRRGPSELARLEAEYPPALDRFLDIGRTRVDPFGVPGRDRLVDGLFTDDRYLALWPYEAMWQEARRLRADARTPYGAVVAIETWLRSTGGFTYDENPPATGGAPPLAHFVAEGKRGYCQHFAGAMALMLRMLGIPARVAAGFTSGKYEDGGWTVTDHNAHAWVEVWFPGFGWLPFDPTPGRGSLTANYSASSTGFNAGDAADGFVGGATGVNGGGADQLRLLEQKERLAEQAQAGRSAGDKGRSTVWLLVLLALAAVVALGLVKLVRRRSRYLTRDPRRLAGAARRELVDFLADQGIAVSASMTPEELHELLQAELGADGRPFARALAEARFGPPEGSAAAASRARRELRKLVRSAPAPARPAGPPARPARAPLAAHVIPAVVIAAGLGTRLRPLTERYAKPVLPVDGTPVIAHLLRELAAAGAPHVTVVTGYRAEQIEQLIGDGGGFGRRRGLRTPERARRIRPRRRRRPRDRSIPRPRSRSRLRARRDRALRRRLRRLGRGRGDRRPAAAGDRRDRTTGSSGACSARACSAMPLWAVGPAVATQDRGAAGTPSVRALDRVSTGDRRGRGDSGDRGRPGAWPDDAVRPPRAQLSLP